MRVFIVHGEADQAIADELKEYLVPHGYFAETESGARGFHHLQASDVIVFLWSRNCVFSAYRMLLEKRLLDAWADERLVLVKLDHYFLPVGARDLPAIDASFESARQMTGWRDVARQTRERMNALLVAQQQQSQQAPIESETSGSGDSDRQTMQRPDVGGRASVEEDVTRPDIEPEMRSSGGVLGLIFSPLIMIGRLFAGPEKTRPTPPKKTGAKHPAPTPVASAPAPPAIDADPMFVSYAHADDKSVGAVVAVVEASGKAVWIDKGGIQGGEGWAGEIVRAIKAAGGVLIMCSSRAFESDHVKREIYLADRYKKPMLPIFLEAAEPPEDFEYFFAGVQWLELFKLPDDEHADAIRSALKTA